MLVDFFSNPEQVACELYDFELFDDFTQNSPYTASFQTAFPSLSPRETSLSSRASLSLSLSGKKKTGYRIKTRASDAASLDIYIPSLTRSLEACNFYPSGGDIRSVSDRLLLLLRSSSRTTVTSYIYSSARRK